LDGFTVKPQACYFHFAGCAKPDGRRAAGFDRVVQKEDVARAARPQERIAAVPVAEGRYIHVRIFLKSERLDEKAV
jgi:hypothetical protein